MMMTSPSGAAVDAVRDQVKQYFETHITDARDGAVQHLRQVEATAVDTVEATAEQVTAPHVEATRLDREATADHVVEAGGHAQDAAASAGLAAQHAEGVSHAEARAGEHEALARGHEDEARVQAEASAGHANRADGHATSAAGSATAAATHEDTARQYAEAAGGHEQAAEAHAQTASTASTGALEAADRIGTAEQVGVWHDETLTARDDAVDARDEAVAAADRATTGIPDGAVTRVKLAPEVREELDGKAPAGHEHVTADITDAVKVPALIDGRENKLVKTGVDGMLHSSSDPAVSNHLTRKSYVDNEVAKKADTGHTHTSEHITDATDTGGEGSGGKVVKWGSSGEIIRLGGDRPANWHSLVNRRYVDQEVAKKADATHTHTAQDVGARPDTWTPTAGEVGARPDTWTPTAAQVGARPASWTPTAKDVGAATPNDVSTLRTDMEARTPVIRFYDYGAAPATAPAGTLIFEYEEGN